MKTQLKCKYQIIDLKTGFDKCSKYSKFQCANCDYIDPIFVKIEDELK